MTDQQPQELPQRTPGATFAADQRWAVQQAPQPVIPTAPAAPLVTSREEQQ